MCAIRILGLHHILWILSECSTSVVKLAEGASCLKLLIFEVQVF